MSKDLPYTPAPTKPDQRKHPALDRKMDTPYGPGKPKETTR